MRDTLLSVPLSPEEREEKIRPLATAGLSTREIEKLTEIPQSTVVRDIKRINTGENPIQQPDPAKTAKRLRQWVWPIAITVTALLILAVALGSVTVLRDITARQPVYAPVFQTQAPIYMCAGITIEGYLTDLVQATGRTCPKGWKMLVLRPGS
jgi:hypothetical protein